MKIHEYYRETANQNLNSSIAVLFPAILIVGGNLSLFQNKEIMLITIPFLVNSLIYFQIYLLKMNRSIRVGRNISYSEYFYQSPIDEKHLLVFYLDTFSPRLQLYLPNGHLSAELKRYRGKGVGFGWLSKWYALYNAHQQIIGYYQIKGWQVLHIHVYDEKKVYLGCFEKKKITWMKNKKDLLDATGKFIGTIEGSLTYMDEKILDNSRQQVGRLRRGWMPLEWERRFPEPNTPVLSFKKSLSNHEELLRMTLLINEYFIER